MPAMKAASCTWKRGCLGFRLRLVAASVLIHGYHYGIEDEAIQLPGISGSSGTRRRIWNDGDFFLSCRPGRCCLTSWWRRRRG